MTVLAAFDVLGIPKPQGSKKAFVVNGKAQMTEAGGDAFAAWRNAVAQAAADRRVSVGQCLDGPLRLHVTFRFPMPASRLKSDRVQGWRWRQETPDTSKLLRALEDGLQAGGLIVDDARFVDEQARKIEVHQAWTGAHIVISRADPGVISDRPLVEQESLL